VRLEVGLTGANGQVLNLTIGFAVELPNLYAHEFWNEEATVAPGGFFGAWPHVGI
jgi:hypothetical protein